MLSGNEINNSIVHEEELAAGDNDEIESIDENATTSVVLHGEDHHTPPVYTLADFKKMSVQQLRLYVSSRGNYVGDVSKAKKGELVDFLGGSNKM